jgi:hypothetical protein
VTDGGMAARGRGWRLAIGVSAAVAFLSSGSVLAWDPATTHAGLTERALAASTFHATLAHQLGRALGSLEPLRLDAGALDPDLGRAFKARLALLDPAGGYRPSDDGVAAAGAWVRAGAVLEKTPPERGRHHFLEPGKRTGLDDGPGLSGTLHAARLTLDDGATVRDAATGTAFALEGMSTLEWLRSPQNDLGLDAFFDNWERAASAAQANERETALVRALLALGGTLAVLEDMGQPAFVRNDFRSEFSAHDTGSEFERFVADRYGAVALPSPGGPVARPDVESFFVAADGKGLAQETQARFFSSGTLPRDIRYDANEKAGDLLRRVNQSLPFPAPEVTSLDLRRSGQTHYLVRDGLRVLAYQRNDSRIHFFLDRTVYADCAHRSLPKVAGYAAGLVNHLLRAKVALAVLGGKATINVSGFAGQVESGAVLHLLAEDATGVRKEFAQAPLRPDEARESAVPPGARKIAVHARGRDGAGAFVAAGEVAVP